MRIIQNIAAVATAIPIIHAALPELNRDFSHRKLIDEIVSLAINEIKIADNGSRFISYLSEYLMENDHMIWTKEKYLKNLQSASSPVSIYSDYDGNQWKFIGIKSNIFEHIIKENQMNKNEVLRTLKSKNWLQLTSSGDKSYQKQVVMPRLGDSNAKSNMYCIKREAFESLRIFSW